MRAILEAMKQLTVTLPDALERKLDAYLEQHSTNPSDVVQTALAAFLEEQTWAAYKPEPARAPFHISPANDLDSANDGATDVSVRTDHYLAEALHKQNQSADGDLKT